jgi:DNA polymerase (family 10)
MNNQDIATQLIGLAHELEAKRANLYRVRAYRRAAQVVLGLDRAVEEIVDEAGQAGLEELPGIGASLAETIATLARTGEIANLKVEERTLVGV